MRRYIDLVSTRVAQMTRRLRPVLLSLWLAVGQSSPWHQRSDRAASHLARMFGLLVCRCVGELGRQGAAAGGSILASLPTFSVLYLYIFMLSCLLNVRLTRAVITSIGN
jgi:hypothetical protein